MPGPELDTRHEFPLRLVAILREHLGNEHSHGIMAMVRVRLSNIKKHIEIITFKLRIKYLQCNYEINGKWSVYRNNQHQCVQLVREKKVPGIPILSLKNMFFQL